MIFSRQNDKNSIWGELNIRKRGLYVKKNDYRTPMIIDETSIREALNKKNRAISDPALYD